MKKNINIYFAYFFSMIVLLLSGSTAVSSAMATHPANALTPPKKSPDTYKCGNRNPDVELCVESNPIILWVNYFINLFVIIVIVGSSVMVAYAGFEYITAGGNAERTKSARDKIRNIVIGLLMLMFMYAFLQWLTPGGIAG